jgi:CheY-like chemotaxis protein
MSQPEAQSVSQSVSQADRRRATVLVYSSSTTTRERVLTALGTSPTPGLELTFVEAATGREVVAICDGGGIDLAILDGEAAPTGGIGLGRQLKAELDAPPPVLLILGRRDDAWLATWSRAEGVTSHPIDAVRMIEAVVDLLLPSAAVATGH